MVSHSLPPDKPILTLARDSQECIWTIEMHNGVDNRLTHELINMALKPALDVVESEWRQMWRNAHAAAKSEGQPIPRSSPDGRGAVIIIGKRSQDKFFSNGLDYVNAIKDSGFFRNTYNPLIERIMTFPIPVIAAINGHCFAGGLILALACDYRVMTDGKERRAWCCMNEIHFGAPWPASLVAVARTKVSDARMLRLLALEGHRFSPQEALAAGLIDAVAEGGTSDAVLNAAFAFAREKSLNARTGVWGLIKKGLYRHALLDIQLDIRTVMPEDEHAVAHPKL